MRGQQRSRAPIGRRASYSNCNRRESYTYPYSDINANTHCDPNSRTKCDADCHTKSYPEASPDSATSANAVALKETYDHPP